MADCSSEHSEAAAEERQAERQKKRKAKGAVSCCKLLLTLSSLTVKDGFTARTDLFSVPVSLNLTKSIKKYHLFFLQKKLSI